LPGARRRDWLAFFKLDLKFPQASASRPPRIKDLADKLESTQDRHGDSPENHRLTDELKSSQRRVRN
jgi:hypothetical protein